MDFSWRCDKYPNLLELPALQYIPENAVEAPNVTLLQGLPRLRVTGFLKLLLVQILEGLPRVDDLRGNGVIFTMEKV